MKHIEITPTDQKVFLIKASFWLVFLGWTAFALALFGIFYAPLLAIIFALGALWTAQHFWRKKLLTGLSREMRVVAVTLFVIVLSMSFFVTPTIFSGRDQGAISEAAVRLAQNHQLKFATPASEAFFQIYGPGKALNFPGFFYTPSGQLTPQFPLAYIAWLAMFFTFLGVSGFVVANAVLLYFFLLTFYLLARHFMNKRWALLLMLFTLTSFSCYWFFKYTLTENMALALGWFSILALLLFLEERSRLHFFAFLFSSFLLIFTRIEGLALLGASGLVLLINTHTRAYLRVNFKRTILWPALFLLVFLIFNGIKDIYFYKEIIKAILPSLQATPSGVMEGAIVPPVKEFFLGEIFWLYGYVGFLLLGFAGIAWLFVEKHFKMLIPFFITLPTWTYLFNARISADHPWMLRRFAFTIVPVFIFYSVLLLQFWQKKYPGALQKLFTPLLIILLLAGSTPALLKYYTYSENKGLLAQTEKFAQNFSDRDLILLDKSVSGNGWAMLTGPLNFLYGKNAVYFFNPQDLTKLDTQNFQNVFLVIPTGKEKQYKDILPRFAMQKDYVVEANRLEISSSKIEEPLFPEQTTFAYSGTIYKLMK